LEAHPDKMPKEIAEILQAQGLDVTPQMVSTTKFNLKSKKDQPAAPKAAPRKARPATKAADAVSLDSLKKAKELARSLGVSSKPRQRSRLWRNWWIDSVGFRTRTAPLAG
jgi:hypothetical protein